MLDANMISQLRTLLTNVKVPIVLEASLDDRPKSADMLTLLNEIAELSDLITVERTDDDQRRPSFAIARADSDVRVRFAGIPLGHEFTSLVLALLHVGGHPPKVSEQTAEAIKALDGDFAFVTYMSLSCQNCPDVVQALNTMSVLNPRISHVAVEGSLFQSEVDDKQIMAVPTVYLNGELFGSGRMSIDEILAKLDTGAEAKAAARLNDLEPFEVLVAGGGPAGAATAIYTARKGFRTGVVAERFGGQVLDTMSIENFVGTIYTEGPKLASALEAHVHEYDVDVIKSQSIAKLVPATESGGLHVVELVSGARLQARSVVIATGARWRQMGVPGEFEYRNRGVTFCPHCDGPLFKGKRVAVIGGGNSGIEAAIDLAGIVGYVTVIEFLDVLRADEVLVRKLKSMPNVDIVMSARTTEVIGDGSKVTGLDYEDRTDGQIKHIDLDGIFVQIGLLPVTDWLAGSVELSDRGEVVIDERGQTSVPGIFAAGDCTTVPYKQIVVAMGAGATAGLSAFDYLVRTSAPDA